MAFDKYLRRTDIILWGDSHSNLFAHRLYQKQHINLYHYRVLSLSVLFPDDNLKEYEYN